MLDIIIIFIVHFLMLKAKWQAGVYTPVMCDFFLAELCVSPKPIDMDSTNCPENCEMFNAWLYEKLWNLTVAIAWLSHLSRFSKIQQTLSRASKSPDFSGDLPIFDNNENLPISRFGMKISRFFFTKDYASTADRQFCHSSRRIDCQFGECCLKPFANCVVIEKKYSVCVCRPRKTPYSSGHSGPTC